MGQAAEVDLQAMLHYKLDYHPSVLADIYQLDTNFVCWQRQLNADIEKSVSALLATKQRFALRVVIKPSELKGWLSEQWPTVDCKALIDDIVTLVEMYAELFDLSQIGFRCELVDKTLCPFFHVDKVLSRLVTTYHGAATQWITEENTNRVALQERKQSAVVIDQQAIKQASVGDVLVFKGEAWPDKQVESIVHRSPEASFSQRRLLLTLDIV